MLAPGVSNAGRPLSSLIKDNLVIDVKAGHEHIHGLHVQCNDISIWTHFLPWVWVWVYG